MPGARVVLIAITVSTALRLYLALRYFGFQGGDDTEIAEEALRRVVHLAYDPWPIRNLFVSDFIVAPVVKLVALGGVTSWTVLAAITRMPFVALAALNIWLVYLLARRWTDETVAVLAASLYAFHWIPLVYGSSQFPRTVSVTCVLLAVLIAERAPLGGGLLIAAATAARYSEAVYLFTLLLLFPKRMKIVAGFAAGCAILLGAYEWATWGRPFGALIEFTRFTLAERASSSLEKHQPPWWYLTSLPFWIAPALWPFFAQANVRRAVAAIVVPVAILSLIHHKELRYLQVVVPFASIAAAEGARMTRRAIAVALIVLAIPLQLYRVHVVGKRTMSAVAAAQWLAARRVRSAGLSQVWAYGGRIYLGNEVRVVDLDMPPGPRELGDALATVDCVAMYVDDVAPRTARLAGNGFAEEAEFHVGRSNPVAVHCRQRHVPRNF